MTSNELRRREAAIGDVFCTNKNCQGEKNVLLEAHVITSRSIYGCGKCGAMSLVHKVPSTLQQHVITIKTQEMWFTFQKQKMNLLPGKQIFVIVPIQSTKHSKKAMFNLYVENKIQEFPGDLYCPTC